MQVPVACISSSVLTFFERFVCLFFLLFSVFFKVNSVFFVHNEFQQCSACNVTIERRYLGR